MKRWDIINYLIEKNRYKNYLEIGVANGNNFYKINCEYKIGIDPKGRVGKKTTSDKFFRKNKKIFDIIFIDGLHIDSQVTKDIRNSLRCLSAKGTIVMHDCNPPTWKHQAVPRQQKLWNGTVWKSFVRLRCTNKNLFMCVVDTDWGCGIIKRGSQKVYNKKPISKCLCYDYFKNNKKELLNLISIREFVV